MVQLAFENQGTNTYLVYTIGENDELDTMSLGMLTNNHIPGFAPVSFMQMDNTKHIKFNVSAKVSASQLFNGVVNKKRLVGVFAGIVDAMLSAEDYMLDINAIFLDLDYIFTDVSTCETVVLCLPIMNSNHKNPELGMFFKNIIFHTQFDQTENCDHVAQILNYLNSNPVLSLSDFRDLLDKVSKNSNASGSSQKSATDSAQAVITPGTKQPTVPESVAQTRLVPPRVEETPGHGDVGKTGVDGKIERTVIPDAPQEENAKSMSLLYLLQHYNKENAAIYKAQQEGKKGNKGAKQAAIQTQQKKITKPAPVGFAVPGQEESLQGSCPVPNQQQTAVPAQQAVNTQSTEMAPEQQLSVQGHTDRPANFGETVVLDKKPGETVVLHSAAETVKSDPHLLRSKNNEKIPLNKPVFRIGKERSYVDYFISDNTAISRSHANIVNNNGEFFVVDTNSTNHTYVNGGMIPSNVETKLSHGTKLRFANEDFEFRMR